MTALKKFHFKLYDENLGLVKDIEGNIGLLLEDYYYGTKVKVLFKNKIIEIHSENIFPMSFKLPKIGDIVYLKNNFWGFKIKKIQSDIYYACIDSYSGVTENAFGKDSIDIFKFNGYEYPFTATLV